MNRIRFALEGHVQVPATPVSEPVSNNEPFTYDEGKGVKNQIIMTGPLSEVLSHAMNVFFEKKPLTASPEAPDADLPQAPAVAQESYSQDLYIEQLVSEMKTTQGLDLVLDNFDVSSMKEHMQQMRAGDLETQLNTPMPDSIFVTDIADITSNQTAEELIKRNNDAVVVVIQNPGDVQEVETTTLGELQAAAERIYEHTNIKLCFGIEALTQHLSKKIQAA